MFNRLQQLFRSKTGSGKRDAYCSFCRKSHRDVGPLVEGPGEVYICKACLQLCGSIIEQEEARRKGESSGQR